MKLRDKVREILEKMLSCYEEIDANVLDNVPNAFQNVTDEMEEKLINLFKEYCVKKEDLPDEEEIFIILENLQAEGKGIYEFAKAIAKRIGKES